MDNMIKANNKNMSVLCLTCLSCCLSYPAVGFFNCPRYRFCIYCSSAMQVIVISCWTNHPSGQEHVTKAWHVKVYRWSEERIYVITNQKGIASVSNLIWTAFRFRRDMIDCRNIHQKPVVLVTHSVWGICVNTQSMCAPKANCCQGTIS